MSTKAHVDSLMKKHAEISERIEDRQKSPASDSLRTAAMKKEKLRLKEEITRLSH